MELSREVHTLLERIKKLSKQTQKSESTNFNMPYNLPIKISHLNLNSSFNTCDEVKFSFEDLIPVDTMDFSDDERWLYVSEMSMISPYTGDLTNWLHQDFNTVEDDISELESLNSEARKCIVDTRTFTRPKKRICRPTLDQLTEGYYSQSSSKTTISDSYHDISKMSLTEESSNDSYHSDYLLSNTNSATGTTPVQFKLSEPVNISFDRILANAGESLDSFTNMSPPSLINSLCSSTFTNLVDSGYVNQSEIVPNVNDDLPLRIMQNSINENDDPNVTYSNKFELNKGFKDKSANDTYELKNQNNCSNALNNGIFSKDLNSTYHKNNSNLSGSSTITKKTKLSKFAYNFKASCPDINRTFQKSHDSSLDLTFQKLSDSQPNLTEDLKRTIFNQSMELMNPTEMFHSARSGSADSLDERSSSISNSSKDSGSKILNMGDLDNLAKAQELKLLQAMSTPKPSKSRMRLLQTTTLSPIPIHQSHISADEEFLSDSDTSDVCLTARSGFSKQIIAPYSSESMDSLTRSELNVTKSLTINNKPEVRKSTLRTIPTMIVKPMEVNNTVSEPGRSKSAQLFVTQPKMRTSGLPRPTSTLGATSIPRPTSRIPGPKTIRPPMVRPNQRPPPKTNWMDGCY